MKRNEKIYEYITQKTEKFDIEALKEKVGFSTIEISGYLDSQLIVTPEGHSVLIEKDPYDPTFNLYKIIEDKAVFLKNRCR